MHKTITVDQLSDGHTDPETRIVDARPTAAFNGWRLQGETRGGHIPGAVAFPAAWGNMLNDFNLVERLAARGLAPDHSIVVYGHDTGSGALLADRLTALGYGDVAVLADGLGAWASRGELALVRLAGFRQLVHPGWLHRLLAGEPVDERPTNEFAVFHVNYGAPEAYEEAHVEGAFPLDTNALESPEDWNRRSSEELEARLLEFGITKDTTVILYGRDLAADAAGHRPGRMAGQIAAARAAAILLYSGVEDVRLLDGGLNHWLDAGYRVETQVRRPSPKHGFGATIPTRPHVFIDYEEALELLANPNGVLVSVRSSAEHSGETSGYDDISQVGDIPGAAWAPCGTDAYHMQNYRNVDNTMRDFNELAANWKDVGITPDKKVAFYCGTGWRASETFFYARLMGWRHVSIYDGGWLDWSGRAGNGRDPGGR